MDDSKIVPFPTQENLGSEASRTVATASRKGASAPKIPQRRIALRLFLRIRPQRASRSAAIDTLLQILQNERDRLPSDAPPADLRLLQRWAEEDDWELEYVRQRNAEQLRKDDLSTDEQLRRHEELVQSSWDLVEIAREKAVQADATASDYERYRSAQSGYHLAVDKRADYLTELAHKTREASNSQNARDQISQIYDELIEQYGALGPQYTILCRRIASLTYRLDAMDASGNNHGDEWLKLNATLASMVNQAQKYTEATKSESLTKQSHDLMMKLLKIVEGTVSNKAGQPRLWAQIVEDIRAELRRVDDGMSASA